VDNNPASEQATPARLALLAATVDVEIGRALVRLDDGTACEMDAADAGAMGEWGIVTYEGSGVKFDFHGRRYYKCDVYGLSHGGATDWRIRWTACGRFSEVHTGE
jgi:hypothetical protein